MSSPAKDSEEQIVYHVYQHGYVGSQGATFSVNNFPVTFYLRPALLFLQWGLWAVYIAGAAKVQQTCNSEGNNGFAPFGSLTGFPDVWSMSDCTQYYSQLWWSVFLQFFAVVGSTVLWIAMFWDVSSFAKAIMYFHIMSSILMFQIAFIFTSAVYVIVKGYPSNQNTPYKTDFKNSCYLICAGSVGNLVCNFIYILWMSWEPTPAPEQAEAPTVDVAVAK